MTETSAHTFSDYLKRSLSGDPAAAAEGRLGIRFHESFQQALASETTLNSWAATKALASFCATLLADQIKRTTPRPRLADVARTVGDAFRDDFLDRLDGLNDDGDFHRHPRESGDPDT